jgi:hypothetical protein
MLPTGPFDQDKLDVSDKPEVKPLAEKDFIQEGSTLGSLPVWIWIFLLSLLIISVLGTWNWYQSYSQDKKDERPFLDVTNRQFSVFLWQFPSFLRVNAPIKTGYLPGFETNAEGVQLSAVENNVSAPPDLLFLYHTWSRLLEPYYIPRSIPSVSFDEFLNQTQEWLPIYWKNAPKEYVSMIEKGTYKEMEDLKALSNEELPVIVRQAYQGWKNYFEEGPDINAMEPTYGEVKEFLSQYPHYARNFWRNIEIVAKQKVAGSDYLFSLIHPVDNSDEKVPKDQLSPFFKVALFNAQQAKLGK